MKIIFTVTNDLSFDQRMERICETLSQAGHEITLVGRKKKESLPLLQKRYKQHRLNVFFSAGKLFYIEYQVRLFFFLLSRPKSTISAIDLDSIIPCLLIAKLKRQNIFFDAHEYFSEVPEVVNRKFTKRVWEGVANYCIPKVDICYTVGRSLADIFQELYGKKFEVIRNVPFTKPIINSSNEGVPIILYQGMLNKGRGIEQMISAMHKIPNAILWLIGEGDLSQALRQQVEQEGLSEKVIFYGFIPPNQLSAMTAQAYIGINLLENLGLSYYYSLANKAFDYIQAGIPSIQMNFPEYKTLQKDHQTFHLIPDLSPNTIAQSIQLLIEDKAYYQNIKSNCLKARKELVWEKESIKLVSLYAGVPDSK